MYLVKQLESSRSSEKEPAQAKHGALVAMVKRPWVLSCVAPRFVLFVLLWLLLGAFARGDGWQVRSGRNGVLDDISHPAQVFHPAGSSSIRP